MSIMATWLRLHFQVSPETSCGQVTARRWPLQSEQTYEYLSTACSLRTKQKTKSTCPLSSSGRLGIETMVLGMMNSNTRGTGAHGIMESPN